MMTYLEDGHCNISNNSSENSIRPVTVGKHNWLFCDTTNKADASMMVYSRLETARANGLNPQKYLDYLFKARPNKNMSDGELENVVPRNPKVQECCINKSQDIESGKFLDFFRKILYYSALTLET